MRRRKMSSMLKELDEISKVLTGRDIPSWTKRAWEDMRRAKVQVATEDPYTILGLDPSCIPSDVVSRYRELAKKYHPDGTHPDSNKFQKIQRAYEAICLARGIR